LDEKVLGVKHKPYAHLVISPYPKELEKTFVLKNTRLRSAKRNYGGRGKKVLVRPIRPEDEN